MFLAVPSRAFTPPPPPPLKPKKNEIAWVMDARCSRRISYISSARESVDVFNMILNKYYFICSLYTEEAASYPHALVLLASPAPRKRRRHAAALRARNTHRTRRARGHSRPCAAGTGTPYILATWRTQRERGSCPAPHGPHHLANAQGARHPLQHSPTRARAHNGAEMGLPVENCTGGGTLRKEAQSEGVFGSSPIVFILNKAPLMASRFRATKVSCRGAGWYTRGVVG